MSLPGTKRTFRDVRLTSAFGGKADIAAELLTRDEAQRIAVNIRVPALRMRAGSVCMGVLMHTVRISVRICEGRDEYVEARIAKGWAQY